MKYLLDTPYKGSRTYIHGSDLFNAISNALPTLLKQKNSYISQLSFSSFSYNRCELILDEELNKQIAMGKGNVTLHDNSQKRFYLVEATEPPSKRLPFDEDSLVAQSKYKEQSIELKGKSPFTSIETIIALTKALSYKETPLKKGKWVFGKIDLTAALPVIKSSVTIECISSIAGRFNINNIIIDGNLVGKIQFIVGTP